MSRKPRRSNFDKMLNGYLKQSGRTNRQIKDRNEKKLAGVRKLRKGDKLNGK